jgi:hypothetical protein
MNIIIHLLIYSHVNTIYNIPQNKFIKNNCVRMSYNKLKSYDENISILPLFQTSLIIKNWLKYSDDIDQNIPKYMRKSLYDFNTFTAINKQEHNIIYLGWYPKEQLQNQALIYLIATKIINEKIEIHRIAPNPFYNTIQIISKDMYKDLKDFYYNRNVSFNELHKYDNRYLLSWNYIQEE